MISEVSLALVLLIGSALLIRTFIALHGVNPGFDSHNVLTMEMSLTGERYEKTAGVAQLSRDGRAAAECDSRRGRFGVHLLPADSRASSDCRSPSSGGRWIRPRAQPGAGWMSASPDYYKLFRIPILRGREFNEHDTAARAGRGADQ